MLPSWLFDTVTSDLDRALHYTLLWGLEGVELRTVGHAGQRVPFVNEEKLSRRLREHDVAPVSVVPGMFEGGAGERAVWLNEIAGFEETLRFCRRVGCGRVVVSAFRGEPASGAAEALLRAGDAAARHGVTVAVLNEADGTHPTGARLAALLEAVDHPAVRAAWDPVAALRAGEDPHEGLGRVGPWVTLVRCSDVRQAGGAWSPVPLGDGEVGWPARLAALAALGFDGPVSLELRVDPKPKHGLADATYLIRTIRDARR